MANLLTPEQYRQLATSRSFLSDNSAGEQAYRRYLEEAVSPDNLIPSVIQTGHRSRNIAPLIPFLEEISARPDNPLEILGDVVRQLDDRNVPLGRGLRQIKPRSPFSPLPNDPTDVYFGKLFDDAEVWQALDLEILRLANESTEKKADEFRRLNARGQLPQVDLSVFGLGPNAIKFMKVVSPYSNGLMVGKDFPWRWRAVNLNSTANSRGIDTPNIPTIGNSTPLRRSGTVDFDSIYTVGADSYTVVCDDDEQEKTRRYPSGVKFGAFLNATLAIEAIDVSQQILLGQVDFAAITYDADTKTSRIPVTPIINGEAGLEVLYESRWNVAFTGPGEYNLPINDAESREIYQEGREQFEQQIREVRRAAKEIDAELATLAGTNDPQRLSRQADLQAQRDQLRVTLPPVWTPDMYWQALDITDQLGKIQTASNPTRQITNPLQTIGIVGARDGGLSTAEVTQKIGPVEVYNKEDMLDREDTPSVYLFGTGTDDPAKFKEQLRPRYRQVVDSNTVLFPDKVAGWRIDNGIVEVYTGDTVDLNSRPVFVDQLAVAAGLDQTPLTDLLFEEYDFDIVTDANGQPVGLGDLDRGFVIGGPATRFLIGDFGQPTQDLLTGLARETTAALVIYDPLVNNLATRIGPLLPIDTERIREAQQLGVDDVLTGFRDLPGLPAQNVLLGLQPSFYDPEIKAELERNLGLPNPQVGPVTFESIPLQAVVSDTPIEAAPGVTFPIPTNIQVDTDTPATLPNENVRDLRPRNRATQSL